MRSYLLILHRWLVLRFNLLIIPALIYGLASAHLSASSGFSAEINTLLVPTIQSFQYSVLPFVLFVGLFLFWNDSLQSNFLLHYLTLPISRTGYLATTWLAVLFLTLLQLYACSFSFLAYAACAGALPDGLSSQTIYLLSILPVAALLWSILSVYFAAFILSVGTPAIALALSLLAFLILDQLLPLFGFEFLFFSHFLTLPLVWFDDWNSGMPPLTIEKIGRHLLPWLVWFVVSAAYARIRFLRMRIRPHVIALLILVLSAVPVRAEVAFVETAQWYAVQTGGVSTDLPLPPTEEITTSHRRPWPRIAGAGSDQGYSLYPETVRAVQVAAVDMEGDGVQEITYQAVSPNTREYNVWIYRRTQGFNRGWSLGESYSFSLPPGFSYARFILTELDGDGLLDGLLTVGHGSESYQRKLFPNETDYAYIAKKGAVRFDVSNPDLNLVSNAVPGWPRVILQHGSDRGSLVRLQVSAARLHKDFVLRLAIRRQIDVSMEILAIENTSSQGYRLSVRSEKHGTVKLTEDFVVPSGDLERDWFGKRSIAPPASRLLSKSWHERPTIHFDFDNDGINDTVTIDELGVHWLDFGGDGGRSHVFHRDGNRLLSGNFADFDGDGAIDELTLERTAGGSGRLQSVVSIRTSALVIPGETASGHTTRVVTIPGMVVFPYSFFDWDHDGDLDCVSVDVASKSFLQRLAVRYLGMQSPVMASLYLMENDGLKANEAAVSRRVSGDVASGVADGGIDWPTVFFSN